ncbi:hypothetical protein ASD56_02380 [Microbacterium sp. Root166]|uniref:enoyl-CoA hydratase/isomerase family protein n=1 Tax=Microbacterium sp. Root166 TaxID=1736478 RepID=UPI0006FD92FC|nr:enoyl-CoA hydratase/isomerase family protein [Microbacterium sp. Root166]KQZ85229.1 hypothetical protein ASD56_02380 [Microbacterium sp. Root166]
MTDAEEQPVLIHVADGVMTISFNRPTRHNAVTGRMHREFVAALEQARQNKDVRVVLIRGEGRSFCSGADVADFQTPAVPPTAAERALAVMGGRELVDALLAVPQPIVAAVRGYAMGLGATIALFSDVVIAADDAVLADTHVNIGVVAGDGGAVMWPLLAGLGRARFHLLTGERVTGALAAEWGLVYRAVPADAVDQEARGVVAKLAALAPLAVQGTKSTLNRIVREKVELVLDHGLWSEAVTFLSDDHREATAAFMEKRTPGFEGR